MLLKRRLLWLIFPVLLSLFCSSVALASARILGAHLYLGNSISAWLTLGGGTVSWLQLGSTIIYTTPIEVISTNLAVLFGVIVVVAMLVGVVLWVRTAQSTGTSVLLVVGALVAGIIGILGVAILISLVLGMNGV